MKKKEEILVRKGRLKLVIWKKDCRLKLFCKENMEVLVDEINMNDQRNMLNF